MERYTLSFILPDLCQPQRYANNQFWYVTKRRWVLHMLIYLTALEDVSAPGGGLGILGGGGGGMERGQECFDARHSYTYPMF